MQVLTRGYSDIYEKEYRRKDGNVVPIELRANLIVNEAGQASGMWGIVRDITERKRSEEALKDYGEELSAIYENAPFTMMLVDEERRVRKVNRYGLAFAGSKIDEVIGLRAGDALRCLHSLDDPRGCGLGQDCGQCVVRQAMFMIRSRPAEISKISKLS